MNIHELVRYIYHIPYLRHKNKAPERNNQRGRWPLTGAPRVAWTRRFDAQQLGGVVRRALDLFATPCLVRLGVAVESIGLGLEMDHSWMGY
jgi:hypothetical protein